MMSLIVDSSAFGTYGDTGMPGGIGFSGSVIASEEKLVLGAARHAAKTTDRIN
jgi:hypothetical protein